MPNQLSHLHSRLTINGNRIEGLSDNDVPVELPDIELFTVKRGKDGTMYSMGTGAKGGPVIIRLLPTSRSAVLFLKWHSQIQTGMALEFDGSWQDTENGYSSQLRGGVMTEAPSGLHPGKDAEFKFEFEEIIPEMDGANFDPAPI